MSGPSAEIMHDHNEKMSGPSASRRWDWPHNYANSQTHYAGSGRQGKYL